MFVWYRPRRLCRCHSPPDELAANQTPSFAAALGSDAWRRRLSTSSCAPRTSWARCAVGVEGAAQGQGVRRRDDRVPFNDQQQERRDVPAGAYSQCRPLVANGPFLGSWNPPIHSHSISDQAVAAAWCPRARGAAAVLADLLANPSGYYVNVHKHRVFPSGAVRVQ